MKISLSWTHIEIVMGYAITNKITKATTALSVDWGWYNSSVGGCTKYPGVPKNM